VTGRERAGTVDDMARRLRVAPPGGLFHVFARGVEKRTIFQSVTDYLAFLALLDQVVRCYDWRCRFYCLMGNHFHLFVATAKQTLSEGMQHLSGCYAQRFNRRYGRKGHLFEDRFGSVMIETDSQLRELFRYLALNPVRAGFCDAPEDWRWSSYAATIGLEPPRFLDIDPVLGLFANDRRVAQQVLAAFVAEGIALDKTRAA
jgi:REP element-mobilizing transposase RayT